MWKGHIFDLTDFINLSTIHNGTNTVHLLCGLNKGNGILIELHHYLS
jgi:hypothetical protein